jgi:hypothetical protein
MTHVDVLVYGLAVKLVVIAAWLGWRLSRELRDDLTYAHRRFRGLRIVVTRGGRVALPCDRRAPTPVSLHGDSVRIGTSAPHRSTNGHRLRLIHPTNQQPIYLLKRHRS